MVLNSIALGITPAVLAFSIDAMFSHTVNFQRGLKEEEEEEEEKIIIDSMGGNGMIDYNSIPTIPYLNTLSR